MPLIVSEQNIILAYRNICKNNGSKTPGTDGKTIIEIQSLPIETVIKTVRNKLNFYQPKKVRRVEIPKDNGKTRPLGIPSIWDRLIQQCILQILEPICEAKFHERNNGFRPYRSTQNAMQQNYGLQNICICKQVMRNPESQTCVRIIQLFLESNLKLFQKVING